MRFVAAIGLLVSGCFYVDPVQTRSAVVLSPLPGEPEAWVARGGRLLVRATLDRPDQFEWHAFACAGEFGKDCNADELSPYPVSGTASTADLVVPTRVTTEPDAPLTQSIHVEVIARDDRGAIANAVGSHSSDNYPVANASPTLMLGQDARSLTVGAPIDLFARYGDADNAIEDLKLSWEVLAPNSTIPTKPDNIVVTPTDPTHGTAHMRLVPTVSGDWDIKVIAQDLQASTERHLSFTVLPDKPPCLVQSRPITPPLGATLPVTAPTVFQVIVVSDDLDSYPRLSTDPLFGTATFAWSILPPGASDRQPLVGATGNTVDFDPAAFTPGDIVELRVEIFDRNHTQVPCADDLATCALEATGCIQRQTWRLEAR